MLIRPFLFATLSLALSAQATPPPRELAELFSSLGGRRDRAQEFLVEVRRECRAGSRKVKESRYLYGDAREVAHGLIDALSADIQADALQPEAAYRTRGETLAAKVDKLRDLSLKVDCDGKALDFGSKGVIEDLRKDPWATLKGYLGGSKEERAARRTALVAQLKALRWPSAEEVLKPVEAELALKPEPIKVEPPKPEPVKIDPPKPEPVKVDPPKPEPVKVDPPKPEPVKVEPPKPEPVKVEPPKPVDPAKN